MVTLHTDLSISMSDEHVELVFRQLAGLLPQLNVGHNGSHLPVELLPAFLDQIPVVLNHSGLALDGGDPGARLLDLVERPVGGLFGHDELRIRRGGFVPPARIDALEDVVDGSGCLPVL